MAEYKQGSMDIRAQEATFAGFVRFATRAIIVTLVVLIIVALFGA